MLKVEYMTMLFMVTMVTMQVLEAWVMRFITHMVKFTRTYTYAYICYQLFLGYSVYVFMWQGMQVLAKLVSS